MNRLQVGLGMLVTGLSISLVGCPGLVNGVPGTSAGPSATAMPTASSSASPTATSSADPSAATVTGFTEVLASNSDGYLGADAAGNLYLTRAGAFFTSGTVQMMASGSATWTPLTASGLFLPLTQVEADAGGNLYVGCTGGIAKRAAGGTDWTYPWTGTPSGGQLNAQALHYDAAHNRLIVDVSVGVSHSVYKVPLGTRAWSLAHLGDSSYGAQALTTDSAGNLWAAPRSGPQRESADGTVDQVGTGYPTNNPTVRSLQFDQAGNLYAVYPSGSTTSGVYRLPAGSETWSRVPGIPPEDVAAARSNLAMDSTGHLFVGAGKKLYELAPGGSQWVPLPDIGVPADSTVMSLAIVADRLAVSFTGAGGVWLANP